MDIEKIIKEAYLQGLADRLTKPSLRFDRDAEALKYVKSIVKKLPIHGVMLCFSDEEKKLNIDGLESAIAICDWDNYDKEEYENPNAQISWYYSLIEKLNKA
ncbi:MAG: hypothetical protein HRT69_13895 [Flavobacteriaceae bacterium]|nr:hypothetical protein [Flavobacteriaceae bacterium]